jgi:hypothetical protein
MMYIDEKRNDRITRLAYLNEKLEETGLERVISDDEEFDAIEQLIKDDEEDVDEEKKTPITRVRWRKNAEDGKLYLDENKSEYFAKVKIIQAVCKDFYPFHQEEGMPLASELRLPLFMVDGIKLYGIIDEVRPLTIRDYKSRVGRVGDYDLKYDDQFTLYAGLMSIYSSIDEDFARWFGASEEDIWNLIGDPLHLIDKIIIEHCWLKTGKVPKGKSRVQMIYGPPRRKEHFYEILERIHTQLWNLSKGNMLPNRGSCDWCLYSRPCEEYSDAGKAIRFGEQLEFVIERQKNNDGRFLRLPLEVELLGMPTKKRKKERKKKVEQGLLDPDWLKTTAEDEKRNLLEKIRKQVIKYIHPMRRSA